jgi:hypothetical protein
LREIIVIWQRNKMERNDQMANNDLIAKMAKNAKEKIWQK